MSAARSLNPALSPAQRAASSRTDYPPVPKKCVVTGGTGFVGIRLVEMLVERGATQVVAFDVVPKERVKGAWDHPAIVWMVGDITKQEDVDKACEGADCVWHLAAAVGPFHPKALYEKVNYQGTLNVISACRKFKVPKLVMSSSPSTRFQGSLWKRPDIDGLKESEMPKLPLSQYMQAYAETKAMGEMAVTAACCPELLTVNVAPHQVYGPRDNLFLPNVLEAAGSGKLRVFGPGTNRICFSHVDNYCHGLIIAERKLFVGSPVLGKFYIVTDGPTHPEPGPYCIFWKEVDRAVTGMGFASIEAKMHLPYWFIYCVALLANFAGWIAGVTFKLNVFTVFALTMNRWFDISAAEQDLEYRPVIPFKLGWEDTIEWFKGNWLPTYLTTKSTGFVGIAAGSQKKIDIQAASALGGKHEKPL